MCFACVCMWGRGGWVGGRGGWVRVSVVVMVIGNYECGGDDN